jgi:hypothetical protein
MLVAPDSKLDPSTPITLQSIIAQTSPIYKEPPFEPPACCKPVFSMLPELINTPGTTCPILSTLTFQSQDLDILDIAMEDHSEGDCHIPGMYIFNVLYLCLGVHGFLTVYTGQQPSQHTLRPVPRHFEDVLPSNEDVNLSEWCGNHPPVTETQNQPHGRIQRIFLTLHDSLQMAFNTIGLPQQYPRQPSFEPDRFVSSSLLAKYCPITSNTHITHMPDQPPKPPYPFSNMNIYRLMTWMNSGSLHKSEAKVSCLIKDVIQADDFNPRELERFSVRRSLRTLDSSGENVTATFWMTGKRQTSPSIYPQSQRMSPGHLTFMDFIINHS